MLEEGDVLLKVMRVGICGTDLHAYRGEQPFFSYPRILGHELATEVLDPGISLNGLKKGDRTVCVPYVNCEQCVSCRAGKSNCCQNLKVFGVHADGGMREVIALPARLLIPANDFSFDEIAIAEPLSIGAHALRRSKIKKNDTVVVMGCGPIGIGIIGLAKYIGATVIAIDTNDHRLGIARESFGADNTINAHQSPLDQVKELTDGDLAQTVFDATGNKYAIESGINYMSHGGTFVLVGLTKGDLTFQHPAIHAKEATLMCSRNATRQDFEFVMQAIREKRFNTTAYVTTKTNYENILSSFDAWSTPDSKEIKVLTVWSE